MELTTDAMATALQVREDEGVLYGEFAHKGMGQGLFRTFSYVGETQDAFGGSQTGKKGGFTRLICIYMCVCV